MIKTVPIAEDRTKHAGVSQGTHHGKTCAAALD
jgi:hypothetical protein